jgi:hypothetical protein
MNIGSRAQVMHGTAKMTGGGLKKKDLKYNKRGKIVSKKKSAMAKKEKRLQKAGFATQKGVFTLFNKQSGGSNNHIAMSEIYNNKGRGYNGTNPMPTTPAAYQANLNSSAVNSDKFMSTGKNNHIPLLNIYNNKGRGYNGTNPMPTTPAAYQANLNSSAVNSDKFSYLGQMENDTRLPPGWHRAYVNSKQGKPVPYWFHENGDTTYNKPKILDLATRIKKEPTNLNNIKKDDIIIPDGFFMEIKKIIPAKIVLCYNNRDIYIVVTKKKPDPFEHTPPITIHIISFKPSNYTTTKGKQLIKIVIKDIDFNKHTIMLTNKDFDRWSTFCNPFFDSHNDEITQI